MASNMRLRLVVRRHGLPDTRVLFSISLDGDPTIAHFLELVNATVPLESDDWGLDDYAVELRNPAGGAFEALHFQPVASILQQDEEVYIRPLLTPDLKRRHVSGRHQISRDGKHLIDGVPFGRPLLRQPRDRPTIKIPPRKRRRILAENPTSPAADDDWDDDEEEDQDFRPLQLTQNGENPSDLEDDDEQDDSFSANGDENDMDLDDDVSEIDDDELSALRLDNGEDTGQCLAPASLASPSPAPSDEQDQPVEDAKTEMDNESDSDLAIADLKSSMAVAFPDAPQSTLDRAFRKCHARNGTYVARKIFKWLKKRHVPQLSYHRVKRHYRAKVRDAAALAQDVDMHESDADDAGSLAHYRDRSALGHMTGAAHERSRPLTPPELLDDDEDDDADDESGYASTGGDHISGIACSDSEDDESEVGAQETQSLSGSTAHESPSGSPGATGQLAELGSGAGSESGGDGPADSDDSESSDSSTHDSHEGDNSEDEGEAAAHTRLPSSDMAASDDESGGDSSASSGDSDSDDSGDDQVAAIQGPASDGGSGENQSSSDDSSDDTSSSSDSSSSEDEKSGSDGDGDSSEDEQPEEMSARPPTSAPAAATDSSSLQQPVAGSAAPEKDEAREPHKASGQGMAKTRNRNARRRRAKSLLLENKILEERKNALLAAIGCGPEPLSHLAPVAGPGGNPPMEPAAAAPGSGPASSDSGDDADPWSAKINYQGAECAAKDVVLSEPPFPFVQRWDPSQRSHRKRKQPARPDWREGCHDEGKRPDKKPRFADEPEETVEALNYGDVDVGDKDADLAHETSVADSQMTDWDDLPSVPADPTTLPAFHLSDARVSMIITWKKWLLSEATQWQPQVADVTAVIGRINEDGHTLDVMMAKRDRSQFPFAKRFDEKTGKRIYRKFDPPDLSDDEICPDAEKFWAEGWDTIAFEDMIEPRIRQAPMASFDDEPTALSSHNLSHRSTNLRVSEHVDGSVVVPDSQALRSLGDSTAEGKSATHGQTDKQAEQGTKTLDSCVPETNQDTATGSSASRPQHPAQIPTDGDALVMDDDELMASNYSANTAAAKANALIGGSALGQYSFPPCQPADDSDSPSRQLTGVAAPNSTGEVASLQVSYPQLHVPSSSIGSVRSGRQPDADDNTDVAQDAFSNAVDTDDENEDQVETPRASKIIEHETDQAPQTPAKSDKDADKAPSFIKQSKSQPLTSIETSQRSQQVKKEKFKAEPSSFVAAVSPPSHSARGAIKGTRFSTSATKKTTKKATPSQPPPGAEIILLSSSPEPVYEEDYAEDDVDEDYEASTSQRSSARNTPGYATATRKTASRVPRADLRGASAPARARSGVSVLGGLSRGPRKVSSMAPPSSSSS
ncbi:hypothetical protein RB595_004993 [Gaeumannomyces hyphopodioides]